MRPICFADAAFLFALVHLASVSRETSRKYCISLCEEGVGGGVASWAEKCAAMGIGDHLQGLKGSDHNLYGCFYDGSFQKGPLLR